MRYSVYVFAFLGLILLSQFGWAQSELYIKKQKGFKQKTLEIHRILNVRTSYELHSGYVVRLTDSTMVINAQVMEGGVMKDSLYHVPFDLITNLEYCKSNDLLKCDKRRKKAGGTFLSSGLGVSMAIALIGLYGGSGYLFLAGTGASIVFYVVLSLTNDRKHYNFTRKWSILTQ